MSRLGEEGWRYLTIATSTRPLRPKVRLVGEQVPLIDIVVTSCGENVDVILDTVRAACTQDYPRESFRVLVSDDANDDILKQRVSDRHLASGCEVMYYSRPGRAGSKPGHKAGNMNAAIAHLDTLGERGKQHQNAEFFAFCDADMMPEPEFLRACIGHLVLQPQAGIAVVPQNYYNVPTNDPLYQDMSTWNLRDQIQRDSVDCAWDTGPGAVFRRQTIVDIGGFDGWAIAEDILAGQQASGHGWQTIYCFEPLQWGLVPDTFAGHVAQRVKWACG